jgi:hypothetical protein
VSHLAIYAIHRTERWWSHLGSHSGFARASVLTDRRGAGDHSLTDDFYAGLRRGAAGVFDEAETADIIARCRVLRSLARGQAQAMVQAMGEAAARAFDRVQPTDMVGFPIDSYVSDILARTAASRGVPYSEFTASALPSMAMLLHRGELITDKAVRERALVAAKRREIADPLFVPSYVRGQNAYTRARFLRTFAYFRLRGIAFRALAAARRDPLNLHYLDAQAHLIHKPAVTDIGVIELQDADWRAKLEAYPHEKRLFLGLQLFPEASIDYWVDDPGIVDYEDMLIEAMSHFARAGFAIAIKDHPLQFGFRQRGLIDRLLGLTGAVLVPYAVSGNAVMELCGANFTCTGTLGLQAALMGKVSVAVPNYYTLANDFTLFDGRCDLGHLPGRVDAASQADGAALEERQDRIVVNLLAGSFDADFFSFKGFDPEGDTASAESTGRALGERLRLIGEDGEAWHRARGFFDPR